ncbi:hypothetical protein [Robiginitalea sp. SC105]|uniref:hypothetical protein n=1 Tax=Robiginitalea sp. SC105 TaxID=2762332 RepID=UPI00163B57D8|nr:hypothetical protein [Robiginitalea sp. SC105]MBC2839928.1 hypothetical protein [Robiginitalea sp. SC105]
MIYRILTTLCLIFWMFPASAQECALGVGGKDTDLIVLVFQLSETQQEKLRLWTEELEAKNAELQAKAKQLLQTQPQSTTEEVEVLGAKYREIKEVMLANSLHYDRLLLGTFNELQYQTYVELCQEVFRSPMAPEEATSNRPGGQE